MIEPKKKKGCCSKKCCLITLAVVAVVLVLGFFNIQYVPIPNADLKGSSSAEPIVIYCERTVKDADKYMAVWTPFATHTQEGGAGVRAVFSFMSQDDPTKALQFFMYDDMAGFASQPKDKPELSDALWAEYAGTSETDFCQVWGGWTEQLQAVVATLPGVKYYFIKGKGFIRSAGSEGYKFDGPIMVMVSKRENRPGSMEKIGKAFQHVTDMIYPVAPGCIAAYDGPADPAENAPDFAWSLRIFSDYNKGFLLHLYGNLLIAPTLALTIVPHWASPVFPVSNSFSNGWMMNAAVAGFPGNAVYTQYHYEEGLLGPLPDLAK